MAELCIRKVSQSIILTTNTYTALFSEVFVIVSVTLFLPIALEQFARDNGVLMPDKTEPCSSLIQTEVGVAETRCVVKIGSIWVDTASFR